MGSDKYSRRYHRASEPIPGVLLLEFNRGPVNAFHEDMWQEMKRIIDEVSFDPSFRAVVLSSALEKHFTAGLDLQEAQSTFAQQEYMDSARKAFELHRHILEFQNAISSLENCRLPIIVALHGSCLGLAIDIASACDIRLAATSATFAIAEVNVGLAADIGTLQRFPKIIGNDSLAREWAMTGRRFSADEAEKIGFVSRLIQGGRKEVLDAALKVAGDIAQKSPVAVLSTKHLMNHARDHTIQEGLEYTAAWNMAMLQAADTSIAMKAALTRQTPKYPPIGRESGKSKL